MITDVELGQLERARQRLRESELTGLPAESIHTSLGMSEACLRGADEPMHIFAVAIMAQAVAFADVSADTKKSIKQEIIASIRAHAIACTGSDPTLVDEPGGKQGKAFVIRARQRVLTSPIAIAILGSALIFKFGDKLYDKICALIGL